MLLNRLPLIAALALCFALAGSLYVQLSSFLDNANTSSPLLNTSPQNIEKTKPKALHNVASFKLFGDAKNASKNAEIKPIAKELPKTKLKLVLTGVMASVSTQNASALIQGPNKETENYHINEELPGGAILKQVYPDRVVIERSGRLENLVFVEKKSIGIESYVHPDDIEEKQPSNTQNNTPTVSKSSSSNPGQTRGIKDRLSKLRKRLINNRKAQ